MLLLIAPHCAVRMLLMGNAVLLFFFSSVMFLPSLALAIIGSAA
jgi:hypothetical protein